MLNSKVQNIYIKTHLKPLNTYNKPCVETTCVGESWLSKKKPKLTQMAKFHPIWSNCLPTNIWLAWNIFARVEQGKGRFSTINLLVLIISSDSIPWSNINVNCFTIEKVTKKNVL